MKKIKPQTPLVNLELTYLDLILEQVFFYTKENLDSGRQKEGPSPTVQDIADHSMLPVEKVIQRLQNIVKISQQALLSQRQFDDILQKLIVSYKQSGAESLEWTIYDLSTEKNLCVTYGFVQLFELYSFHELIGVLSPFSLRSSEQKIIFVCENGNKSYSAALYLRECGMKNVFYTHLT
ncbi:MAG: rhodanese-like domain-containing protein [Bdellovibrionota bacterium]